MKPEQCAFSSFKIYPGHGHRYIHKDGKSVFLINNKSTAHYLNKMNPRLFAWTVLYRKSHKKGHTEEAAKKRTRRVQKFTRAIVGASLEAIKAKRNQKPEQRALAREQALREAKEKKKEKAGVKKSKPAASQPKGGPAQKAAKQAPAPQKGYQKR